MASQAGARVCQGRGLGGRESITPDQSVTDSDRSAGHTVQLFTDEAKNRSSEGPGLPLSWVSGGTRVFFRSHGGGFLQGLSPGP